MVSFYLIKSVGKLLFLKLCINMVQQDSALSVQVCSLEIDLCHWLSCDCSNNYNQAVASFLQENYEIFDRVFSYFFTNDGSNSWRKHKCKPHRHQFKW